jgi:hypothetical protein
MPRAIELIHEIGFPVMLLLLIAAVVVSLIVWRVWRASPLVGKLLTLVIALGSIAFVAAKSVSPAGRYAVGGCRGPGFEALGISDEYYLFSSGVYYDVVNGRADRAGSYYKRNGQWILRMDRKDGVIDEQKLRFSVLGFDTVIPPIDGNEGGPTSFNRRRLIPFTKPSWMPEWLE